MVDSNPDPGPVRPVYEHPWAVRFAHWASAVAVLVLTMSGLQIFSAFPSFGSKVPQQNLVDAIPEAIRLGGWLGGALQWHFTFMWVFAGGGALYIVSQVASGHFRTVLFTSGDLPGVWPMVRHYFFFAPRPPLTGQYNPLQKLAYTTVTICGGLSLLTGLAIYKPVQLSGLAALCGGFHNARLLHFASMCGLLAFIPGHLVMVAIHGWDNFQSMLTGWKRRPNYPAAMCLGLLAIALFAAAAEPARRPIVVVELFTSEGCSSCPPADDVLRRLASAQLDGAADVVALGEHVDYWDRLGWRDPFSQGLFSSRQSDYDAAVFKTGRIYTPQLVVDGQWEAIGSDVGAVRRAVAAAARRPKATVVLSPEPASAERLRVRVQVDLPPSLTPRDTADVMVAVTEDQIVSRVRRGENGGRTLTHAAVTRSLGAVGTLAPTDRSYRATADLAVSSDWNPAHLRVVAFVQERASRRIVGASATGRGDR